MHHAVGALLIFCGAVVLPCRRFHQISEALGIAFLQKVAGPLPSEYVIRGVSPRRAVILAAAHEKIQEQRRLVELPGTLRTAENPGKQLRSPCPLEKVLLIRGFLIAV